MRLIKHICLCLVHLLCYGAFLLWTIGEPTIPALLLMILFIWISCTDFILFEIPDLASVGLLSLGLWLASQSGLLIPAVISACIWAALFYTVAKLSAVALGQDALGLGDVKLMAGVGALLGPFLPIYVVLCASIAAIVSLYMSRLRSKDPLRDTAIAFGPFLCLSTWVIWLSEVQV